MQLNFQRGLAPSWDMFVAVSTCMVCAICIVTVRVVNNKRCFSNAAMAAERESCGRGWCKELRARDGACVRVTGVTRDCERWEMRADERRAYVRATGRTGDGACRRATREAAEDVAKTSNPQVRDMQPYTHSPAYCYCIA
jgi:hypothetical protein